MNVNMASTFERVQVGQHLGRVQVAQPFGRVEVGQPPWAYKMTQHIEVWFSRIEC